jgi:hypothetical protein
MDRSSGDGADSAEDSGSSQHYHNSLPGIPKACSLTTMFSWVPFTVWHVYGCNSRDCVLGIPLYPFLFNSVISSTLVAIAESYLVM